ncbi:MAG: nicotinate-nicotinamide nucleotide adenylyltransferase [Brevinematales bacterium]|nr:nicotinate-nicotinamide nucleotide adenylyltransferase [Brevinematales bacterium]
MRVGILGGAFDPPHNGHILLGRYALEQLSLERVIYIPTRIPPHKQVASDAPPELRSLLARVALCAVAPSDAKDFLIDRGFLPYDSPELRYFSTLYSGAYLARHDNRMEVSDIEIARTDETPSYTVDTVGELRRMKPDWEITIIIGEDQAATLDTWRRIGELSKIAEFAVARRDIPDTADGRHQDIRVLKEKFPYIRDFTFPKCDISSTMIRGRIRAGLPLAGMVPVCVETLLGYESIRRYF